VPNPAGCAARRGTPGPGRDQAVMDARTADATRNSPTTPRKDRRTPSVPACRSRTPGRFLGAGPAARGPDRAVHGRIHGDGAAVDPGRDRRCVLSRITSLPPGGLATNGWRPRRRISPNRSAVQPRVTGDHAPGTPLVAPGAAPRVPEFPGAVAIVADQLGLPLLRVVRQCGTTSLATCSCCQRLPHWSGSFRCAATITGLVGRPSTARLRCWFPGSVTHDLCTVARSARSAVGGPIQTPVRPPR
jgi:hypothetical protein